MRLILACSLLILAGSCRVSQGSLPGIWQPAGRHSSYLHLQADGSFEWSLLDLSTDSLFFPGLQQHGRISGQWQLTSGRKLTLIQGKSGSAITEPALRDSIARFTSISSFQFIDRFGLPISIRQVMIPPAKPKPHYGNSLYYFAQDIPSGDTIRFFFDGFPVISYPGSIMPAIGNNYHQVTLLEPYIYLSSPEISFKVKRRKLVDKKSRLSLIIHKNNP